MRIAARGRTVLLVLASLAVLAACSSGKAIDGVAAGGGGDGRDGAIDGGGGSAGASWDAAGNETAAGEGGGGAGAADGGSGSPDASDGGIMMPLTIPATANIWGSGHAIPPDPSGHGPGVLPPFVELPPGTGRIMTVTNVSGSIDFDGAGMDLPENGADGIVLTGLPPLPADAGPPPVLSLGGIVAMICAPAACTAPRIAFLAAVYLASGEPAEPSPAPYAADPRAPVIEGVAVGQTFFVGDGLDGPYAGTGEVQTFRIPDDATRVFFGFFDFDGPGGPIGSYDNNTGQIRATVTVSR